MAEIADSGAHLRGSQLQVDQAELVIGGTVFAIGLDGIQILDGGVSGAAVIEVLVASLQVLFLGDVGSAPAGYQCQANQQKHRCSTKRWHRSEEHTSELQSPM